MSSRLNPSPIHSNERATYLHVKVVVLSFMLYFFQIQNKVDGYRLLGRQVNERHRIPLLGDFHPQEFFSLSSGRRRPAPVSFLTVARFMPVGSVFFRVGGRLLTRLRFIENTDPTFTRFTKLAKVVLFIALQLWTVWLDWKIRFWPRSLIMETDLHGYFFFLRGFWGPWGSLKWR